MNRKITPPPSPLTDISGVPSEEEAIRLEDIEEETEVTEGMSRGFAMSAMADLQREYLQHTEDDTSTFNRVISFGAKKTLEVQNIFDRGLHNEEDLKDIPRFTLETGFSKRLEYTIREMQYLLKRASILVPGRQTTFQVDPYGSLLAILRGARSMDEMNAAWIAMSKRLSLSDCYFEKYGAEFRTEARSAPPRSPVSTVDGIYEHLPQRRSNAEKLMFLSENVHHHREDLPKERDIGDEGWLFKTLQVPERLISAFPERLPEERPSTVYYTAAGERSERIISERSSWKKGDEFTLPQVDYSEGPEPGSSDWYRSLPPWPRGNPEGLAEIEEAVESWEKKGKGKNKAPQDVPRSPRREARTSTVPNRDIPNPLSGIASAAPYGGLHSDSTGSSAREGWGGPIQRNVYASTGPMLNVPSLLQVPIGSQTPTRDRPPHINAYGSPPMSRVRQSVEREDAPVRTGIIGGGDGDDGDDESEGTEPRERKSRAPRHRGNHGAGGSGPPGRPPNWPGAPRDRGAPNPAGPGGGDGGGDSGSGEGNGSYTDPTRDILISHPERLTETWYPLFTAFPGAVGRACRSGLTCVDGLPI
ncbi:hypothetical protein DFH09DRAFT_1084517 [Mycena vulgaris]|nr:hypothetical protein DFH09DRAFT_1084517 [Mycena vulgaris]